MVLNFPFYFFPCTIATVKQPLKRSRNYANQLFELIISKSVTISFLFQLEKWWENVGYLMPRSPVAPYINIAGPISISDIWPPEEGTQLKRAAIFTYCLLQVWKVLYRFG